MTCTQSKTWFFKVTFLITNSRLTPNSGPLNHLKRVTSDVFRPWISVLPAWWWWGTHECRSTTCDAQQWVDSLPCQTSSNITPPKNPLSLSVYIYISSQSTQSIQISQITFRKQCPLRPSGLGLKMISDPALEPWVPCSCCGTCRFKLVKYCISFCWCCTSDPKWPDSTARNLPDGPLGIWGDPKSEFKTSRSAPYKSPNTTPLYDFGDAKFPKQYLSRVFAKRSYPGLLDHT